MVLEQFIIDADIIWDQVGKTFFENPEAKPGRIMRVQVVNAGIIEDLTGYTLNLGWTSVRDPSKFGLDAFDDVDITKGIFEIEYTSGMLTNIGPLNASLQLVPPGQGRPIESNNFKLTVKNSAINPEAIQGETSFKALENALVEVNGWNTRIDVVEQEFKDRADALDGAYPVRLTAAEQSVAAVEAQVDLLNRGLGETMPTMASLLAAYPTGDTRDHIVAGNIAEVDTLTVTGVPTTAGNVTVTLNGIAKTVAVDPAVQTTTALVATAIRAAVYTGWTTGGTGSVVTFTATTVGTRTAPTFNGGTTGATGTFARTAIGEAANFHRYFWNGSAWTDGGAYQAIELANGSVGMNKLDSALTEQLNNIRNGLLFIDIEDTLTQSSGFIKPDFTLAASDPNFVYSQKVSMLGAKEIYFELRGASTACYIVAFYDISGNVISGIKSPYGYETKYIGTIDVPSNATHARFCWAERYNYGAGTYSDPKVAVSYYIVESLKNTQADLITATNYSTDYTDLATNFGFINDSGAISSPGDTNWVYSDLIEISTQFEIKYEIWGHSLIGSICFYSSAGTFIQSVGTELTGVKVIGSVMPPSDAEFMRISFSNKAVKPTEISRVYIQSAVKDELDLVRSTLADLASKTEISTDLAQAATNIGFMGPTGLIVTTTDDNWVYSDYLPITENYTIDYAMWGHQAVGSLVFFNSAKEYISGVAAEGIVGSKILGSIQPPAGTSYVRLSMSNSGKPELAAKVSTAYSSSSTNTEISFIHEQLATLQSNLGEKAILPYIHPYKVYTVCNDIIAASKGHNRNYAAAIYLDHFFKGLTSEKRIRFGRTGSDKYVFYSPMRVMDSNESSPTVQYNGGVNILETTTSITITGEDIEDTSFSVIHASTLNSITASAVPKVLCIGDSITYGELAQVNDDDHTQNWVYHLMAKELFMKDNIDAGSGHDVRFLGHFKKTRNMIYKGTTYPVKSFHEGIRGISLSSYLNGTVTDFKSSTTNKFSIDAWLSKYRTLDDTGARLTLGAGTGSLINSGNIANIDVCTPTHVLILLGANGGGTLAQYQELIQIIKTEHPNMIIGIAMPDMAGTYFPSHHPKASNQATLWDYGWNGGLENQHVMYYNLVNMLQAEFATPANEANGIFLVPFYFTQPSAESVSMRKVNLPDSDLEIMSDASGFVDVYGWVPNVHVNGVGHVNWGYQLYSWLKYTAAKMLN